MLFRRRNRDLDDEIAAHLAMARRDGLDTASFGNTALIKEVTRETWGWAWLGAVFQDLRYGLRMMRRAPGFTAVAVLSLALGIGANTAIFSLIDALALRRLPVREPDQLVEVLTRAGRNRWNSFSWPAYLHLREHNSVFSGLLAAPTDLLYTRPEGRQPERLEATFVSGDCFEILGIEPALGRLISPADDGPVAAVSWTYWQTRFAGDPAILGARLQVEDTFVTVVGVLPRGYTGLQTGRAEHLALPLAMAPVVRPRYRPGDYGAKWIRLAGRLKPGVTIEQARAEMNVLFQPMLDHEGRINDARTRPNWTIDVEPASAGLSRLRDQFSKPLVILMSAVGLLLLLACANVAGLLLSRASAREREMAIRFSIGASRLRIVRQTLTESLLLSGTAAALGAALAYFGTDALLALMNSGRMSFDLAIRPNTRILAFTASVSLLTGVLFGIAPALRTTRRRRFFGKSLVVAQVALSVILLTAAGLFVTNLSALQRIDLGFRRDHVLLVALDPADELQRGYRQLLQRFETIPGVRSASLSWIAPISGGGSSRNPHSIDGRLLARAPNHVVYVNWIAPRFFETMGTPLVAGRDFRADEPPGSAIVNQTLARQFFGEQSPIGRRIDTHVIVGIAGDAKYLEIREDIPKAIYLPLSNDAPSSSQFLIRTSVDPASITADVRRAVNDELRSVAIGKITTLERHVNASIVPERLIATLSGIFGALGALLAAIGLYGLLAYTVARRTQEIGIRMALGATRSNVLGLVLRDAVGIVLIGLALGIPGAIAVRRLIASWMPGAPPLDPSLLAAGAAIMIVTAALAGCLPARKASRIEPIDALRR